MFSQTPQQAHHFDISEVSCELNETFSGKTKTSITVTNTGNIDVYIRVQMTTHWVDEKNTIIGEFASMPDFDYDEQWLKKDNTYYYKVPIRSKTKTVELLKSPIVLESKEVEGKMLHQEIDVFAEAIQSVPQEAVTTSWNVILDAQGHIQDVK